MRMCEDIAPPETAWCNHKRNYVGGDRFCRWCKLDYHHLQRSKWTRLPTWFWYMYETTIRCWYTQHDVLIISAWSSTAIVLLSLGFHIIGFLMAVASFAFAMLGIFLANLE